MVKSSSRIVSMQQTLRLSPSQLQPAIAHFSFVAGISPDNQADTHANRLDNFEFALIDDQTKKALSYALSPLQTGHVFVAQPVNTGVEQWVHHHFQRQDKAKNKPVAAYIFNVAQPDCPQFVTFSNAVWVRLEEHIATLIDSIDALLRQSKGASDIAKDIICTLQNALAQVSEDSILQSQRHELSRQEQFCQKQSGQEQSYNEQPVYLAKNVSWLQDNFKARYAALWHIDRQSAQWDAVVPEVCQDIAFILRPQALNLGHTLVAAEYVDDSALTGQIVVKHAAHIQQHQYEIIPGLLHQALFGCLLLPLRYCDDDNALIEKLLIALQNKSFPVGTNAPQVSVKSSVFIRPENARAPTKVVFLGHPQSYYSMQEYFVLFDELVHVLVDISGTHKLDDRVARQFSHWVQWAVLDYAEAGAPPYTVDEDALRALAKTAMMDCENDGHINCDINFLRSILDEAIYIASQAASTQITSSTIKNVLANRARRHAQVNQSVLEDIDNQQILIETTGSLVGSVNGLTVFEAGQVSFGTPARITATVYPGTQGVVDIEREVELGQSIHSKGVLLLTGLLGSRYAQDFVLSLSANIALEQSYADIDGDSASLAEFIALLSAICQQPVTQSIALTGSINQCGDVQSVGGINQKIEGYFAVCQRRGHSSENYGVIIPKVNVGHLNLADEIIEAVGTGRFSIYAVSHIDEVISLMFNKSAGELKSNKQYPKQSINDLTQQGLIRLANIVNGEE